MLNKRYKQYSNALDLNEPVLAITRLFIDNSLPEHNNKDLLLISNVSFILVESVKQIEETVIFLKNKYY